MIYNQERGCLYDSLYYGVIYFNEEKLQKNLETTYGIKKDDLISFCIFKRKMEDIPQEIYPFFYSFVHKPTYITDYFLNNFDFWKGNLDSFITQLKNDVDLKNKLFNYFLNESHKKDEISLSNKSICEITDSIFELELDKEITKQLINLFFDYDNIFTTLLEYLSNTYIRMCSYHTESSSVINKKKIELSEDKIINNIKLYFKIGKDINMNQQTFSISLLNNFINMGKWNNNNYSFILGVKSDELLHSILDLEHIQPEHIAKFISHDVKNDILEKLLHNKYTATQLSKILYKSRQSINSYLLSLYDDMIIEVAEVSGTEIYYRINHDYFKKATKVMYKYLKGFEEPKQL